MVIAVVGVCLDVDAGGWVWVWLCECGWGGGACGCVDVDGCVVGVGVETWVRLWLWMWVGVAVADERYGDRDEIGMRTTIVCKHMLRPHGGHVRNLSNASKSPTVSYSLLFTTAHHCSLLLTTPHY